MEDLKKSKKSITFFPIISSFISKLFIGEVTYLVGLYHANPFILACFLAVCAYKDYRRSQNIFNQQVSMAVSFREAKGLNLLLYSNGIPPWVIFPDTEYSECLNKIISNVWPRVSRYFENDLKSILENKINDALHGYKNNLDFTFYTLALGSISPRIGDIKVYHNQSRVLEYIILDIMIVYAGDIDIYFYIMSIGGGIQNLEITGCLRIVFKFERKPNVSLGGIEIFLLRKPNFDYNFAGLMDIFGIPGIKGLLRRTIDDQLSSLIVLPNKITQNFNDVLNTGKYKCPDPEGLICINAVEARGLVNSSGVASETIDTYVTIEFGYKIATSDIFDNSMDPNWNFSANFIVDHISFDECVSITVNDRAGNSIIGKVTLDLNIIKERKILSSWVQLEDTTCGMINLKMYYYSLTYDLLGTDKIQQYVLIVFVSHAFRTENRSSETPNSTIYLKLGNESKSSKSVLANNPAFEETFVFFIGDEAKKSHLELQLVDTNNSNALLGHATILLQRLFDASFVELVDQTVPLLGGGRESYVLLSMRLRAATE